MIKLFPSYRFHPSGAMVLLRCPDDAKVINLGGWKEVPVVELGKNPIYHKVEDVPEALLVPSADEKDTHPESEEPESEEPKSEEPTEEEPAAEAMPEQEESVVTKSGHKVRKAIRL